MKNWVFEYLDFLQNKCPCFQVLMESEQLRLETDNAGPQEELEYWKSRAARLSLLVDQVSSHPCKLTLATLKCAQCKLVKVSSEKRLRIYQDISAMERM